MGLSTTTPGAHILVRQVGERYQFMHTRGVRVGSEDPPNVFPPLQVDESPSPRRRIVGKSPAASIEAKGVQVLEEDLSFRTKLQAVLCDWDPVVARKIILQWHRDAIDSQHKTGLFRRGGNVGVHSATFQDEHFTELLNRFFLHYAPGAMYTSLLLSGTPQELHMDSGNAPGTCNIVLPVLMPRTGGHHWSEVRPGDVLQGNVCEMLGPKGEKFFGTVRRLKTLQPALLDPRRRHAVTSYVGQRLVLVGYTIQDLGKVSSDLVESLQRLGFPLSEGTGPSYSGELPYRVAVLNALAFEWTQDGHAPAENSPGFERPNRGTASSSVVEPLPIVKRGGWSEQVRTSDSVIDFSVDWGLKVEPKPSSPSSQSQGNGISQLATRASGSTAPCDDSSLERRTQEEECAFLSVQDGQQPNERSSGSAEGSEQVTFLHDVVGSVALALPLSSSGPHEVSFTALPSEAVYVRKIEQSFTRGIEAVLDGLTTPLGVVHLVDPGEARQHIDRWVPSLEKELAALEPAIQRFVQDDELHQQLQSRSDLIELPAKVVFTVKPPNQGALETETSMNVSSMSRQERETHLFRRKSRIVACGNMTEPSSWELYAAGATSEVLRIIIAETSFRAWALGVLDIVAAFLGTPMPPPDQFPPVVVRPPGVLRLRGLAGPRELWLLRRALYGLREAPRLWCLHRDRLLRLMTFETDEGLLCLKQSSGDENVWMLQSVDEEESEIKGYILVYVDDILLAMPLSLMRTVASKLQSTWDTSPLCVASREVPVKFLGLDVVAVDGGFFVTQETYVDELARIHNPHPPAVTPLTREECSFELTSSDIPPTPELTLECQQRAGELLWLSQRSRPDIAFTSALVSSLSTRAPARAIRVAQRALRYVASTRSSGILFVSHGDALDIFTDASFAPEGTKSHTGYAIFYRNVPVLWRSARQGLITLSTAESEHIALQEGAVAGFSVKALIQSLRLPVAKPVLHCDSTAALAIQAGSGSSRTRHLRVRSAWLKERVDLGELSTCHRPGSEQRADLLTKPFARPRLLELNGLWGLVDKSLVSAGIIPDPAARKALLVLLFLLQASQTRAQEVVDDDAAIKSDVWLYGIAAMLVIVGIAGWEFLRFLWRVFVEPKVIQSERRVRKLRRLQEAVQEELQEQLASDALTAPELPVVPKARIQSSMTPASPVQGLRGNASSSANHAGIQSPHLMSSPPQSQFSPFSRSGHRARSALALYRDASTQTEFHDFVVHTQVVTPPEVYVTTGRCFHLYQDCSAVQKARGGRWAPLCEYCRGR